jgi:hypothetical protein
MARARERALAIPPQRRSVAELSHAAHPIEQQISALEKHAARLHIEVMVEAAHDRSGKARPMAGIMRSEALLAQGCDLGIAVERPRVSRGQERPAVAARLRLALEALDGGEEPISPGLRARIFGKDHEPERDSDYGIGW